MTITERFNRARARNHKLIESMADAATSERYKMIFRAKMAIDRKAKDVTKCPTCYYSHKKTE